MHFDPTGLKCLLRGARNFFSQFLAFFEDLKKNWDRCAHTVRIFLVMMVIRAAFLSDGDETQILGE